MGNKTKLRIVRISMTSGIQYLADWDGEDYLWSPDQGDTCYFADVNSAQSAACALTGHVRLEGWTGDRWSVDYNNTLANAHIN